MTVLLAILSILLIAVVLVQIGKVTDLAARIRGEEDAIEESNNWNARFSLVFLVLFLIIGIGSGIYYKNSILWWGPHQSASAHGGELDSMFDITLLLTGIVFVITQILLFWFAYKYKHKKGRKALFMPHDTRLEIIWTMVPAITMSFLVIKGLVAWNEVMGDVNETEEYVEIEATGMQFAWIMRYPGPDNALGTRDFRLISPLNSLGQDWDDPKNLDDIVSSAAGEVVKLPLGKKVRVRITARDVLHNFYLPHFRVKMDAVPGMPTYFVFTPSMTTQEYRENLGAVDRNGNPLYPEWHEPYDPTDPESGPRWKKFHFELACAELCGNGHYSMRRIFEVVPYDEWKAWMAEQSSFYLQSIRNTDEDPYKGKLLEVEVKQRREEFNTNVEKALSAENDADKVVRLNYVTYETGSANLSGHSKYELNNVADILKKHPQMTIEIAGHTDNVGDPQFNLTLSQQRAESVFRYLTEEKGIDAARLQSRGYGEIQPIGDNATDAGRQENRRTEMRILTQ